MSINTLQRGTQVLQQQMPQYIDRNNFTTPQDTKRNKDTFNTSRLIETSQILRMPQTNNVDSSFFKPSKTDEDKQSYKPEQHTQTPDIFLPFGFGSASDVGKYRDLNEQSPVYEWTLPDATIIPGRQVPQTQTSTQTKPSGLTLPLQLIKKLNTELVVFDFNKKLTFTINSVGLLNKLFNDNQMMIKWTGEQFPQKVILSKLSVYTDTTYTGTSFKDYMYWHENTSGQPYYLVELPVDAKINDEKGHFEGRVGWIISDQVGFIPKNLVESTHKMKFGNIEIKTQLFNTPTYFQTKYSMTNINNDPNMLGVNVFVLNARNSDPIISDVSTDLPPLEIKSGTIMYLRTENEFVMFGFSN